MYNENKHKNKVIKNFNRLKRRKKKKSIKFRKLKPMLRLIKKDMIECFNKFYKTEIQPDSATQTMCISICLEKEEVDKKIKEWSDRIGATQEEAYNET